MWGQSARTSLGCVGQCLGHILRTPYHTKFTPEIVPASWETPKALTTLISLTFLIVFFSKLHTHRPSIDPITAPKSIEKLSKSAPKTVQNRAQISLLGGSGGKVRSWRPPGRVLGRPWWLPWTSLGVPGRSLGSLWRVPGPSWAEPGASGRRPWAS